MPMGKNLYNNDGVLDIAETGFCCGDVRLVRGSKQGSCELAASEDNGAGSENASAILSTAESGQFEVLVV